MGSNGGVDTRTPESAENDARHTIDRQMPNLSQIPCYSLNERTRKAGRTVRSGSPSIMHPRSAAQRTASHAVAGGSPFTAVEVGRLRCNGRRGWAPPMYLRRKLSLSLGHATVRGRMAPEHPRFSMAMPIACRCHLHADGRSALPCDRLTSLRPKARPARLPSGRAPSTCALRTALLSNAPAKLGQARGQGPN
jgi:hypothetical protein